MSYIQFTVTHRSNNHSISIPADGTLESLQTHLAELTNVPVEGQKLLFKGKRLAEPAKTMSELGLKDGVKLTMLGNTSEVVQGMIAVEQREKHKADVISQRKAVKVRSTGPSLASQASSQYKFHKLVPLPHLPAPDTALALLTKLSQDAAIRHVMAQHKFAVGVLTELAPHEQPHLLGLNVNAGEQIKLRLRTDRYDGFRNYNEIRRVLCHELTHNVWGDHDDNFKALNSRLNREVAQYEAAVRQGTHSFGSGDVYEPGSADAELEAEANVHVLGGSSASPSADLSREERRQRILDATLSRLKAEEAEIEDMCGTKQ